MALARARIRIRGVVQGVGFRPFVYRVARDHAVRGWVINTSGSVDVEAEQERHAVQRFLDDLVNTIPPLARIDEHTVEWLEPVGYERFEIRESRSAAGQYQLVPPDIATCADCRRELFDPADRRYRYPFINCTNCGPRFTIIEDVPYDRPLTSMKVFPMCPDCEAEYGDPLDRRFHAQPDACPVCGPAYRLVDAQGAPVPCDDVVAATAALLLAGRIVAPKGLGGFHLACDATNPAAVAELRTRKGRPAKPFAVMVRDLDEARTHCDLSEAEAELLQSPAAPIVVLSWRADRSNVVPEVAPGIGFLGVMLPYTPFHHLLLERVGRPLVMTSANRSEEPIATGNDEALERLGGIADAFVLHNRTILTRCDDSVLLVEGETRPLRRARGYAPDPIRLAEPGIQTLACGAEEKNTICLTRDRDAFLSQHIGDLENSETLDSFEESVTLYQRLFRIHPELLACDLHPEYLSSKWARARSRDGGMRLTEVQHHHAHVAACMAEHGIVDQAVGIAFDGTGFGPDGTIWGGEVLHCTLTDFRRLAHLEPVPMPGGAAAIRRPARMALGYLLSLHPDPAAVLSRLPLTMAGSREAEVVAMQLEKRINTPVTSSAGRLFDGVAALAGIRAEALYEAQAAIELEMLAHRYRGPALTPFPVQADPGTPRIVRLGPLVEAVVEQVLRGTDPVELAARFHVTMAALVCRLAMETCEEADCPTVAVTGGVFQNRLLLRLVLEKLNRTNLRVLTHRRVPCNDGAIALGQAVVAQARHRGGLL